MSWYAYLAYFLAGALFANGVPHFVNGVSGRRFQSPFARPPGVGESSPLTNVVWGFCNFVAGCLLVWAVGGLAFGFNADMLVLAMGVFVASAGLAVYFGRVRSH